MPHRQPTIVTAMLILAVPPMAILPMPVSAATILVPADQPTIQAAIDAAVNGDTIIVAAATYNEAINFNAKAISLQSANGPDTTTIDAAGLNDSVVKCVSAEGPATILQGFTITGGTGDTVRFPGFAVGGGMFNDNASPTVINCNFVNNTAQVGGGIYNNNARPTITHSSFITNTVTQNGAGMFNNFSSPTVTHCHFDQNTAADRAGALYCDFGSFPMIVNCAFIQNAANFGGAIYVGSNAPTIVHCTFTQNTANNDGGALFNVAAAAPVLANCILWNNIDDADASAGGPFTDESAQIHAGSPIVNFSCVQGRWTGAGNVGNINADPLFTTGPQGNVYLSQVAAGQLTDSPCLDTAVGLAAHLFVAASTRTDQLNDATTADMGFHFNAELQVRSDTDGDNDVDTIDFTLFASCFNKSGHPPRTLGCSVLDAIRFDFDNDRDVDIIDFSGFAACFNKSGHPPRTAGCPAF